MTDVNTGSLTMLSPSREGAFASQAALADLLTYGWEPPAWLCLAVCCLRLRTLPLGCFGRAGSLGLGLFSVTMK